MPQKPECIKGAIGEADGCDHKDEASPLMSKTLDLGVARQRRPDDILDPQKKRHPHLDMMRIVCVGLVAVDHGDGTFSKHDVLFTQSWVLQLLWLVAGISWSFSSRPLHSYLVRLALYFVLGVGLNWLAFALARKDWRSDLWDVVFQMWFVFGLGVYCIITAPLKPALREARAAADKRQSRDAGDRVGLIPEVACVQKADASLRASRAELAYSALVIFGGIPMIQLIIFGLIQLCTAVSFMVCGGPCPMHPWLGDGLAYWLSGTSMRSVLGQVGLMAGAVWIVFIGTKRLKEQPAYLAWMLLLYVYVCRIFIVPEFFGQGKTDRFFCGFEFFVVGLTASYMGLKDQETLSNWMALYWFVLPIVGAFMWDPSWKTRFDEFPSTDPVTITRVKLSEALCVVGFLVAGERLFDARIFTQHGGDWLCDWALLVFLTHKAIHTLLYPPANWVVLVALLPITMWCRRGKASV